MCLVSSLIPVLCLAAAGNNDGWAPLFDGKTLDGWSVHSGFAKYHVTDGEIVGTAVKGSPNSFLCSDKEYGDFVLEFEVKCDPNLNSGVQIRSHIAKEEMAFVFRDDKGQPRTQKIPADRVYGYQVEIAAARVPLLRRHLRRGPPRRSSLAAVARGLRRRDGLQGHANGTSTASSARATPSRPGSTDVPCADCQDSLDARGIIGLQVHGIGNRSSSPTRSAGGTSASRNSESRRGPAARVNHRMDWR